ncbi:hypothetical protein FRC04_011977 [Tulasnella sp. 424]|nr:hypothetical protein FRC04_011977 [Tulasnella sp. 424]KAG8971323.1 hypothetical protein FRC05_011315 [Tulasnella sp. 425]
MDAPQISTLNSKEDTPQPTESLPATKFVPYTSAAGPSTTTAAKETQSGRAPVYVEEDEEDQLIDDDDEVSGPPGRLAPVEVAGHPRTAVPERLATQPPRQQLTPTPSVASVTSEPPPTTYVPPPVTSQPSQSTTPRRRTAKPRKTDDASSVGTSPVGSAPAKKKRNRTAIKATLEVGRQEPETHDNTGTTSAWRLDGGPGTAGPPMQMTIVQQDEMSIMNASAAPKQPAKRKRAPKAAPAPAPSTATPPVEGSSVAPPPRKRQRTQPKKPAPPKEEGTPDYFPPAAYQDIAPDVGTNTPYEYFSAGPPTHVDQFRIPENGIEDTPEEALAAAPLRPLPHFTNAVAPGSFIPWQTYTGPLERTGKKCRRWAPVQRSIKSIGGGVWFAKTWVGGGTTEIEHVKPPLVLEPPKLSLEGPAPSVASESEKPAKLPRTNKPRERKSKVKAEGGGSASATATPPTHASTPIPALTDATAELEKLAANAA